MQLIAFAEDQVMDGLPLPTKDEGEALTLQETGPGFVTVTVAGEPAHVTVVTPFLQLMP